ncbi:IS1595 family transposase, partial [Helicobacter sp. T3_23-1059]
LLHLKETEFRYNTQIKQQDLYKILLKMIRNNPLKLN